MIIIGIAGAHSSIGKTTLCERLLRELSACSNGYLCGKSWGAIKYTRSNIYCSMSSDIEITSHEDKDTARMLKAGAKGVVWVQSPPERLAEVLPMAVDALSGLGGIVVEGNSAVEFLRPDIVVFLDCFREEDRKPSALRLINQADIIIQRGKRGGPPREDARAPMVYSALESINTKELVRLMEEILVEKAIERLLSEKARDAKISCKDARDIAEQMGVPYELIGKKANQMNIKIRQCELGCF